MELKNFAPLSTISRLLVAAGLIIATVAVFGVMPQAAEASTYNGTVNINCSGVIAAGLGAHILDRDNTGSGQERIRILATDGAGNVILDYTYQNTLASYGGGIGSWNWTTAPEYNPITFKVISVAGNGLPEKLDYTATGSCPGLPDYVGADMVPIPSQAVVGSFVATTAVYGSPNANAESTTVMEAGKTAWVYGVDASGQFYKVMLAGKFFWVPVNTMGPNYDEVWNGTPLPTTVVS